MNAEEALAIVETVLNNSRLSKLQKTVFCSAWEEQSYGEIARQSGYEVGYVKQAGSQLWQRLSQALNEKVTKHNLQLVLKRQVSAMRLVERSPAPVAPPAAAGRANVAARSTGFGAPQISPYNSPGPARLDWGDAVDSLTFFGRASELALLKRWIGGEGCRFVGLFGMGGIGKTSLAVKLAQELAQAGAESGPPFDCVVWRSLRNAPPLLDLLADLIVVLSNQPPLTRSEENLPEVNLPETADGRIRQLLRYLQDYRCLIVFDNGETIMRQGDHSGGYLPGYEGYAQLWQRIGESVHQSAVVLTSREKPREIAQIEGEALPVRSLRLSGLPFPVGQEMFSVKGSFSGSEADWRSLIGHYGGNPLALKLVAPVIRDVFAGRIPSFLDCLQEGSSVFGEIQDLLAQQVNRLSVLEQQVMYWLAIARQPISLSQLRSNFVPAVPLAHLLEALSSLERRCLIEKTTATLIDNIQPHFTLQPVVMEYLTDRLIEQVCTEIWTRRPTSPSPSPPPAHSLSFSLYPPLLLTSHALIQAQVKDYIRETQTRLILNPIADRLLTGSSRNALEKQIRLILADLQTQALPQTGYAAGNLLNLLRQIGTNLQGWDFSGLTVWNAYLRHTTLHQVNFTAADLSQSVFTETFSQILTLAFSPDGKWLATGDVNHEIHLWQTADGKQLLSLKVNQGWIWSVAFSPDGRWLASTANRTVNLWNVQTGECVKTFSGCVDRVFSVAFSPDGQLIATGGEDHRVRVWNLRSGQLVQTLEGHQDEVRSIAFSPDNLGSPKAPRWRLASGSYDGTIRLWNVETGDCLNVLHGHQHWVWSVAFSPDGLTLASGSSDRTIKLWNLRTGDCLRSLSGHTQTVRTVAFSPNGRTIASGSDDRTVRLWDYRTGECQRLLTGHSSWISAVAFSPDAQLLASGSEDQSVRLWDSRTKLCLKTLQGYSNGIWSVAFDTEGTTLASGSQDRMIRLWNPQTGHLLATLSGHGSWIWSVAFSPTMPLLASGSEDGTIRLWNRHTHSQVQILEGHQDAVLSVLFSRDGRSLVSGSLDGTIKLWDTLHGDCQQTWRGHRGGIWSMALSPDGRWVASSSQDQTIKLWDMATGRCWRTLVGHRSWIRSVAISPDQQLLVSGAADGEIRLWRLDDGRCQRLAAAHQGPVLSIAFHPSGRLFASSSTDTQIKLWNPVTADCHQTLEGHDRWVRCLCFSPDGRTLASSSQDETIKLWTVALADSEDQRPLAPAATRVAMLLNTLQIPRPYEGMILTRATGLTPAQRSTLKRLGAIDWEMQQVAFPSPRLPLVDMGADTANLVTAQSQD